MNTILNQLLLFDLTLLENARGIVSPEYAFIIQFFGELVVFYWASLLVAIWLFGVYRKDNSYKQKSLAIFFTIISIFIVYAIINLGIPQWRPGATEAVRGGIAPLIPHPIDNSFPSGHALFTGALLFWIFRYFYYRWIIVITIIVGVLTLTARVFGGVHYPGDIIAGLFISLTGAYMLRPIIDIFISRIAPFIIRIAGWIKL